MRPSRIFINTGAAATTAALTGTAFDTIDEDDITGAGTQTVIIDLTNDTWIAAGTGAIGTEAQSLAICTSLDGDVVGGNGWDNEVKANFVHTDIARTSDTRATITIPQQAGYNISSTETITMGDIANAVLTTSETDVTPSNNTFTIASVVAGRIMSSLTRHGGLAGYGGIAGKGGGLAG